MDSKKLELEDAKLREIERRERELLRQFQSSDAAQQTPEQVAQRQAQEREFQRNRVDYTPAVPIVPLTEAKRAAAAAEAAAAGGLHGGAAIVQEPVEALRARSSQGLEGLQGYIPPPDGANNGKNANASAKSAQDKNKKKVVDPLQKWALVNISNTGHSRPSSNGPHIRIVGAYSTTKSTEKPRTKMSNACKSVHFYRVPVGLDTEHCKKHGDFFVVAESDTKQTDARFANSHLNALIQRLGESQQRAKEEFQKNKTTKREIKNEKEGLVPPKHDTKEVLSYDQVEKLARETGALKPEPDAKPNLTTGKDQNLSSLNKDLQVPNSTVSNNANQLAENDRVKTQQTDSENALDWDDFPRQLETRGQNFACIAVIPDTAATMSSQPAQQPSTQQPAVRIFATFETEEDAKQFQIDVLGRRPELQVVNQYVVNMYQWIPLTTVHLNNSSIASKYRNDELDAIMTAQRVEQEQIAEQKERYAQNCKMRELGLSTDSTTGDSSKSIDSKLESNNTK